jgi:hypothetical protein
VIEKTRSSIRVKDVSPSILRRSKLIQPRSGWTTFACLALLIFFAKPACAQHGDYPLGTVGILGAQQAPVGLYYSNVFSYYHASGNDFAETGLLKCGPRDRVCLSLNLGGNGSLDLFIDQNIIGWTTPLKFLGANYGFFVDIPFAIADARSLSEKHHLLS